MTRINTNISSLTAQTRLQRTNNDLQTSLTRLSTGLRINSGKDDPAGLIASESLRSDITSLNKALSNTQRASQIIATADSALGQVSSLLNDIRGLVTEAANSGALSDEEIAANQLQVNSSLEAINRIAQTTTFQGRKLLDGSLDFITKAGDGFSTTKDLQINQANLGTTGNVSVAVSVSTAATKAEIRNTSLAASVTPANATGSITFGTAGAATESTIEVALANAFTVGAEASRNVQFANASAPGAQATGTLTIAAGLSLDIAVRDGSVRDGLLGNGVEVKLTTISSGVSNGSFDNGTGVLTLNLREGQSGAQAMADLANDADLNQVFQFSNGSSKTASVRTLDLGSSGIDIKMTAVAGELLDGVRANTMNVVVTTSATASSTAAVYDANANQLNVVIETGLSAGALATALGGTAAASLITFATAAGSGNTAALDTGSYSTGGGIVNTTAGVGEIVRASQATVANRTGVLSGGAPILSGVANAFKLTAVNGGPADGAKGNDTVLSFTSGATTGATYDATANKINVTVASGATISQIATAINTDLSASFQASNVTNGSYVYSATDNGTTALGGPFANGLNPPATPASFRLIAVDTGLADGARGNLTDVKFQSGGTTGATYDATLNRLIVTVAEGATVNDVASAINTDNKFNVVAGQTLNGTARFSLASDLGVNTPTVITAGTEYDGKITVTSKDKSTTFNKNISFVTSSGNAVGEVKARFDVSGNIEIVTRASDKVTLAAINNAINNSTEVSAKYSSTLDITSETGDQFYNVGADAAPTIVNLTGGNAGGGLDQDVNFELTGFRGAQEIRLKAGASLTNIIDSINSSSDTTGVEAVNESGNLLLRSTTYGSKAVVAVNVTSGSSSALATGLTATRANGKDVVATVNGFAAVGDGNTVSISNSSLDFSISLAAGSTADVKFDITGGGALFQLGGDVVSSQQARLGIGSLSTARLGGISGRLSELADGQAKSLKKDIGGAANVIDEVINKVTGLRGRLGAFQRTTLESNTVSLNDTLSNLNEAQSTIRDADFAKESANLTRAQILVQSGTSVLGIANQSSQSVLSLLR